MKNIYGMTNCKITNLWMGNRCASFLVIADTERFGDSEIMYQGSLRGCESYLLRHGIRSYKACYQKEVYKSEKDNIDSLLMSGGNFHREQYSKYVKGNRQ